MQFNTIADHYWLGLGLVRDGLGRWGRGWVLIVSQSHNSFIIGLKTFEFGNIELWEGGGKWFYCQPQSKSTSYLWIQNWSISKYPLIIPLKLYTIQKVRSLKISLISAFQNCQYFWILTTTNQKLIISLCCIIINARYIF